MRILRQNFIKKHIYYASCQKLRKEKSWQEKTKRSVLFLKDDELQELNRISQTRIAPAQEIQRAKILLSYYENPIISEVARKVGVVRDTIYKCIDKALEIGVERALKDLYHSPRTIPGTPYLILVVSIFLLLPMLTGFMPM